MKIFFCLHKSQFFVYINSNFTNTLSYCMFEEETDLVISQIYCQNQMCKRESLNDRFKWINEKFHIPLDIAATSYWLVSCHQCCPRERAKALFSSSSSWFAAWGGGEVASTSFSASSEKFQADFWLQNLLFLVPFFVCSPGSCFSMDLSSSLSSSLRDMAISLISLSSSSTSPRFVLPSPEWSMLQFHIGFNLDLRLSWSEGPSPPPPP